MKNDKRLFIAKKMPPLKHKAECECFDICRSEVVQWLIKQPELLNYIFDQVKKKEIIYDSQRGTWQGVDYVEHDGSFSNCKICSNRTCEEGYWSWDV